MGNKRIFGRHLVKIIFLVMEISRSKVVLCRKQNLHFDLDANVSTDSFPLRMHSIHVKRSIVTHEELRRNLVVKLRTLPVVKLNRYKVEAVTHLQNNLIRTFRILSTSEEKVPVRIRAAAKKAMIATQMGRFNPAIVNNLGVILKTASLKQEHPAEQLRAILTTIIPYVPQGTRNPLQGVLGFVSSNLFIVNALLTGLLGVVPNLLAGVINSLANSLGIVTEALNGTLGSLGVLLGGVIA